MLIYASVPGGENQIYIPRLANQKVYIRGKTSGTWNDWICVQDYNNLINKPTSMPANGGTSDNSKKLGNINASEYLTKDTTGILKYPIVSNDGLQVDLTGARNGRLEYINTYNNPDGATNLPIAEMVVLKTPYVISSTIAYVVLYEIYPVRGRMWICAYNQSWTNWKLIAGEYTLWTGSAQEGDDITLSRTYRAFNKLELRTSNGMSFEIPTYTSETYDGRVYKGGYDEDFNLYGINTVLTTETNLHLAKAKYKSLMDNTTKSFSITRVIGKA
ncbi:hypothetical protein NMU03_00635 [Allocoprobacillus halotolerans]|uniref:Uncharacterized protein n=1 Tax=Allocoprobacillus halotolerans TaxID=2944914 RepID=A0ABY5I4R6_9FIRM|nr:hypothetical protein [Allocoprobacillus halotolerans]MDC6270656.1 hypothetical protein [Lysinibacillus sphaericus]UTY39374.1 hypothetical protein NMU03_00635 [Allocoprobacillus halotolerans]